MITVTRLNGKTFTINAVYIETVESFPDTTITLANGRKYVVKDDEDSVKRKIIEFYQSIGLLGHKQLEGMENEE
jgi:flagellar protein FlbD